MTIYIWFVVQQMYVSLTYPFNIVQHTLSHIVEHRKLDSLTTPDKIVWSTVTSCWTNNVRQFVPSLMLNRVDALWCCCVKPGFHISRKDRKHTVTNMYFKLYRYDLVFKCCNGGHSFDSSQQMFSIDLLRALKSSLKHRRKHVLRPLQLYGNQAKHSVNAAVGTLGTLSFSL